MNRIDIISIVEEGRRLRAEDLRRGEPVFAERGRLYLRLMWTALCPACGALNDALRRLFSWNPRAHRHA